MKKEKMYRGLYEEREDVCIGVYMKKEKMYRGLYEEREDV